MMTLAVNSIGILILYSQKLPSLRGAGGEIELDLSRRLTVFPKEKKFLSFNIV